jgi:hypothetical protein
MATESEMRKGTKMKTFWKGVAAAVVAMIGIGACAVNWVAGMPGSPVPVSQGKPDEMLKANLIGHVNSLAFERNTLRADALDRAAAYIETALRSQGYQVESQWFETAGVRVRNLEVVLRGRDDAAPVVVIGAHYDSARGTPGADDNASGVAGLLELARMLRAGVPDRSKEIRLVFFTNEEPPYFRTQHMGSYRYAERLNAKKRKVEAMLSLEMLGYYCDVPGCQKYPFPHAGLYPDRGNFIGFVGNLASRPLTQRVVGSFREHAAISSEGISAPALVPGVDFSDHLWFWSFGYPAVMVTDTSFMRYAHYHEASDTPEKLDYARMALVVAALELVIRDLTK